MKDHDIVTRLRNAPWTTADDCNAAADEIERLREQLRLANIDNFNTIADAERLRAERDEARRRLCVELLEVEGLPLFWKGKRGAAGIAERLGWDCFKENTDA